MHTETSPLAGQTVTLKSGKQMIVNDWFDRATGVENGDREVIYGTDPETREEYAIWTDEIDEES